MSRPGGVYRGVGIDEEECAETWVCLCSFSLGREGGIWKREEADGDPRGRFMADKIMPLSAADEGYELFDSMKVQKVIFDATK